MRKTAVILAAVLAATAVAAPAGAATSRSWVDGIWRTDGYGMVISVGGGHGKVYQTTAISCLPAGQADQLGPPGKNGVVRFGAGGVTTTTVRPNGHDRAWLHPLGSAGSIGLRRIHSLPRLCSRPAPKGPVADFDIFWATFAENYPFFAAQKINWQAVRNRYRPLVNAHTTDQELFKILVEEISPLGNAHTDVISANDRHGFEGLRPGTRNWSAGLCARANKVVDARLGVPLRTWGHGNIAYAGLPGRIGYLRISAFENYAGDNSSYQADRAVLNRALDAVFTPARTPALRGLIIDVRCNPGGDDALGLQVASRLTRDPYLAYTKRARNDPRNPARFTRPQPITVRPARAPVYGGRIAILTSDLTNSAGETFTQAMMGRTPRPVRIGLSTQGVFSDILNRVLPDGILFGLPNEEFLTRDGQTFDNRGVPPDIQTPVFTNYDLSHNRDPALAAARALLTAPRR
jgi:Peptidase family S41/Tricorn protease C1 domain